MTVRGTRERKLTLTQFIEKVPATLMAFVQETVKEAKKDDLMDPNHAMPEAWWYREVAAYINTKRRERM